MLRLLPLSLLKWFGWSAKHEPRPNPNRSRPQHRRSDGSREADQLLKDALDLAYLTAQRPADVLKMAMSDIQGDELIVRQGKTGKTVRIALVGRLAELIARVKERARNAPVAHFALLQTHKGRPLSKGMLHVRFDAARTAAGVSFQYRDLRPMGLTAQPDLEAARALAGHGTSAITNRVYRRGGERAKPNE